MRILALSLILLSVSALVTAQSTEEFRTYGALNGRAWKSLEPSDKSFYLMGILEGMVSVLPWDTAKKSDDSKLMLYANYPPGLAANEACDAVDRFFAEPENLLISISNALRVISMKVKGMPQKEIDAKVSALRATASTAPERK